MLTSPTTSSTGATRRTNGTPSTIHSSSSSSSIKSPAGDRAEEFWNSFPRNHNDDPSSPSTFLSLSSAIENLPVDELRSSPFLLMVWLAYLESHQARFPAAEGEEEVRRLFKLLKSEQVGGPGLGRALLTLHYAHFEWSSGKLSKALQLMNDKSLLTSFAPSNTKHQSSPLLQFLPKNDKEIHQIRQRILRNQKEDSTIVPCDFLLPSLIVFNGGIGGDGCGNGDGGGDGCGGAHLLYDNYNDDVIDDDAQKIKPKTPTTNENRLTEQTLQRLRKLGISSSSTATTSNTTTSSPSPLPSLSLSQNYQQQQQQQQQNYQHQQQNNQAYPSFKKREIPPPSPVKEIPNSPLIKGPLSKQPFKSSMDNVFAAEFNDYSYGNGIGMADNDNNNDNNNDNDDMSLTNPEIRASMMSSKNNLTPSKPYNGVYAPPFHTPSTPMKTLPSPSPSVHTPTTPATQQQQPHQKQRSIKVNGQTYKILNLVGRGGSSRVFKVLSVQTNQVLALKKVSLRGLDPITLQGYLNEINLLSTFKECSNIIHLMDFEIVRQPPPGSLLILMEYGEADLGRLLQSPRRKVAVERFPPVEDQRGSYRDLNFIRHLWQQMLLAVETVHQAKIVHCDLKPANFLLVNGMVKLIDFGISKAILSDNTTTVLRENQVGTVNYMSPEALEENNSSGSGGNAISTATTTANNNIGKKIKIGRSSDVWSLGCILYEMVYGRPPFAQYTLIQRLQKILDPNHLIEYPPCLESSIVDVIKKCLRRDPKRRPSLQELLLDPFLVPSVVRRMPPPPHMAEDDLYTNSNTNNNNHNPLIQNDTVLIKRGQLEEVLEQFAKHLPPGQQLDAKGLVTKLFEQWKKTTE